MGSVQASGQPGGAEGSGAAGVSWQESMWGRRGGKEDRSPVVLLSEAKGPGRWTLGEGAG